MRNKLQKLLNKLDGTNEKTLGAIRDFESGVRTLQEKLQENIQVSTLEEVNLKINKFRKNINVEGLHESIKGLEDNFKESVLSIFSDLEEKTSELKTLLSNNSKSSSNEINEKSEELYEQISTLQYTVGKEIKNNKDEFTKKSDEINGILSKIDTFALKEEVKTETDKIKDDKNKLEEETKKEISLIRVDVQKFRTDFMSRLAEKGSGNMNRQILVGGNPSTLGKYTDINIKAGTNMTITYSNNETTKRTDITFASSGGSSSVGGTVRSINTVSTSQAMGSVAGTDYVYLATAGVKLDLPPASGNTNLYTVKNVSNSSVLVTGTIDDDVNGIIMPIKYTSVDLISNDTNFNIT